MTQTSKCLLAAAVVSAFIPGAALAQSPETAVVQEHPFAAWSAHLGAGWDFVAREAVQPAATYVGDTAVWLGSSTVGLAMTSAEVVGSGAGVAWQRVVELPGVPARLMEEFIIGLQSGHFDEFALLVDETGFAIADIKVGVGLIPELAVEFKHVRDLTEEELEEVEAKIQAFSSGPDKSASYLEAAILHSLVEAGKRAGGTDLNTVDVHVFPLPGLTLKFDLFDYEEHKAEKLETALDHSEQALQLEAALAEQFKALEARASSMESREISMETREAAIEVREAALEERIMVIESIVESLLDGRPDLVGGEAAPAAE